MNNLCGNQYIYIYFHKKNVTRCTKMSSIAQRIILIIIYNVKIWKVVVSIATSLFIRQKNLIYK